MKIVSVTINATKNDFTVIPHVSNGGGYRLVGIGLQGAASVETQQKTGSLGVIVRRLPARLDYAHKLGKL
jgi:hypothetical protein